MSPKAGETLSQALVRGHGFLKESGSDTSALDARLLLQAATGLSHEALVMRGDDVLPPEAAIVFRSFLDARIAGKPVSRIVGRREFWGLALDVCGDTLDPRPDTETLVEAVLGRLGGARRPYIRDLGTGSGAILLALLSALPDARGLGSDLSFGALRMARRNALKTGIGGRAAFLMSDWGGVTARRADVVVSNPPYIARGELPGLVREVRGYDPVRALDGGADGLEPYRRIAGQLPVIAQPNALLAFEIGHRQADQVRDILNDAGARVTGPGLGLVRDMGGRPRVVVARAPRR